MTFIKNIASIFYQALIDTVNHDGIEHAGYIAFLFLLALFPFLVFFFSIAGAFGQSELGVEFVRILLENNIIPPSAVEALQPRIHEIINGPPQGLLTLSVVGAIWTASSSVEGLRTILNRAYRVKTPPSYVLRRLLSIGQFLVLTAMLIAVTLFFIVAPTIWKQVKEVLDPVLWQGALDFFNHQKESPIVMLWNYIRYAFTALVLFTIVCVAYYSLPNIKQKWLDVAPGAMIVVCLWFLAGKLLSGYLTKFEQVNVIYGSLAGVIAALLFFYIAATIFVLGAEFNYLLEKSQGKKMEPKEEVA